MDRRRRRIWTAIGLAAGAAALAAPPAGATVDSFVAAGPDGTAHFTWAQNQAPDPEEGYLPVVHARRLTAAGTLGVIQPMSPGLRADDQRIGVDAAGNALVAWLARDENGDGQLVQVRRRTPAGALSATQTLSPSDVWASDLKLDVEPDGDAVLTWSRALNGKYVVQARRRSATGTLGPILTVSYAGAQSTGGDVEVTPGGVATVVWNRYTTGVPSRTYVQTRTIAPDGTLGDTQTLSPTTRSASPPRVVVSDANTATIAWVDQGDNGVGTGYYRVRSAGGTLGAPVAFAANVAFDAIALANNGAGRTAFAWLENVGEVHDTKGRIREAAGGLGAVFDIGGAGSQGYRPSVAVDPQGNATFAWTEQVGEYRTARVRRRSVAGAWGPLRVVSNPAGKARGPHLAVDADGKATVAWLNDPSESLLMRTVSAGGTMSPSIQRVDG